jgi:hypothetical protein
VRWPVHECGPLSALSSAQTLGSFDLSGSGDCRHLVIHQTHLEALLCRARQYSSVRCIVSERTDLLQYRQITDHVVLTQRAALHGGGPVRARRQAGSV